MKTLKNFPWGVTKDLILNRTWSEYKYSFKRTSISLLFLITRILFWNVLLTAVFQSAAVSPSPPENLFTCDVLDTNVEHLNVGASQPSTWRRCLWSLWVNKDNSFQFWKGFVDAQRQLYDSTIKQTAKKWGSNKQMKEQHRQRGFYHMWITKWQVTTGETRNSPNSTISETAVLTVEMNQYQHNRVWRCVQVTTCSVWDRLRADAPTTGPSVTRRVCRAGECPDTDADAKHRSHPRGSS